jgi:hypothetical protein
VPIKVLIEAIFILLDALILSLFSNNNF